MPYLHDSVTIGLVGTAITGSVPDLSLPRAGMTVDGNATLSGIVTVAGQAILGSGTIDISSGADSLIVQSHAGSIAAPITGGTATRNADGSHSIALYQNPCYAPVVFTHVSLGAGVTASPIAVEVAGGETTIYIACFLAGTRIATDRGDIPVERLAAGDRVVTLDDAERRLSPVRWLGSREIDLTGLDGTAALEAAPVRIHAHAFAANIPARDLLITPEHCILVDGGLIPARMLVNGASIVRDRSLLRYTVYHVECDLHSILLSDGLTTESYLDTGNRGGFASTDPATREAAQGCASRATDSAAPLTTARAVVEPIRRRLLARAKQLGLHAPAPASPGTTDPALRLRLEDGTVLRARRRTGERHFFLLPAGTDRATLLSRSGVPADIEGPYLDDRRRPGVLVHSATLWMELHNTAIPLAASWLQDWHPGEHPGDASWTDGAAEIRFDSVAQATVLEITLAGTMTYGQPRQPE